MMRRRGLLSSPTPRPVYSDSAYRAVRPNPKPYSAIKLVNELLTEGSWSLFCHSGKRDPDGTEAGGLERSLSVTGNFGAGSGSGALMKGSRFAADSMLEGEGFELPVREHRDSRMRTHLVVNHRVAVHVPVLIYRLRPRRREQQQIGAVAGSGVADRQVL